MRTKRWMATCVVALLSVTVVFCLLYTSDAADE